MAATIPTAVFLSYNNPKKYKDTDSATFDPGRLNSTGHQQKYPKQLELLFSCTETLILKMQTTASIEKFDGRILILGS